MISHNGLAEALLHSAEMIVGEQNLVDTLGLEEGDGLTNFIEKVRAKIDVMLNPETGLLVMVDLLGGTPWNAVLGAYRPGIEIVSGMNLPMLLEVLMSREQYDQVAGLANLALESGHQGLQWFKYLIDQ